MANNRINRAPERKRKTKEDHPDDQFAGAVNYEHQTITAYGKSRTKRESEDSAQKSAKRVASTHEKHHPLSHSMTQEKSKGRATPSTQLSESEAWELYSRAGPSAEDFVCTFDALRSHRKSLIEEFTTLKEQYKKKRRHIHLKRRQIHLLNVTMQELKPFQPLRVQRDENERTRKLLAVCPDSEHLRNKLQTHFDEQQWMEIPAVGDKHLASVEVPDVSSEECAEWYGFEWGPLRPGDEE